jgi:hypothetical protein
MVDDHVVAVCFRDKLNFDFYENKSEAVSNLSASLLDSIRRRVDHAVCVDQLTLLIQEVSSCPNPVV